MIRVSRFFAVVSCLLPIPPDAQSDYFDANTNLYIALVRFSDTPPHGWSGNPAEPGNDAYTMEDFERLFGEGSEGFGPTDDHTVADDEELPSLYGSVKDYFHYLAGNRFTVEVDVLNPSDEDGYPVWLELQNTKSHYEDESHTELYDDAYAALTAAMSTASWYPDTHEDYDLPNDESTAAIRSANKLGFIYAGYTSVDTGLHPRADLRSYAQYMMGERLGSDDDAGRFAGIGTNVHEVGHLLGLNHGLGTSQDTNPYTSDPIDQLQSANFMFWCSMQSGADGPVVQGGSPSDATLAYMYQSQSCPNPFNPFYMKELGWGTHTEITSSTQSQIILPSPGNYHYIYGHGATTLYLEFRPVTSFGKYIQWFKWDEPPGLLLWKEDYNGSDPHINRHRRLIPADQRSIANALTQTSGGATSIQVTNSTLFPWLDLISDPFGADMHTSNPNGLRTTIATMKYYQDNPGSLPTNLSLRDPAHRRTPDWASDASHFLKRNIGSTTTEDAPTYLAVRNIHIVRVEESGHAVANVYKNYLGGDLVASVELSGDIYVGDDVVIGADEVLTIADNSTVYFLNPKSPDTNSRSDFVVEDEGRLAIGQGVTFRSTQEEYTNDDGDRVKGGIESHGLIVKAGGRATIDGLTLYEGTHTMKGEIEINGDISVGDGSITVDADRPAATLVVDPGSEWVVASKSDASNSGSHTDRVEVFVQNGSSMTLNGTTMGPESPTNEAVWRGLVVKGNLKFVNGATFKSGSLCMFKSGGKVLYNGTVSFENCGMVTGPNAKSLREDDDSVLQIGTYNRYSQTPTTGTWSLEGKDADDFVLSGSRVLSFDDAPDYEKPTDRNSEGESNCVSNRPPGDSRCDNIYEVRVLYAVETRTLLVKWSQDVLVTVTDYPEPTAPTAPTIEPDAEAWTDLKGAVRLKIGPETDIASIEWRIYYLDSDGLKVWNPGFANGRWRSQSIPASLYSAFRDLGRLIDWDLYPSRTYGVEGRVRDPDMYSDPFTYRRTTGPPIAITVSGTTEPFYYSDWEDRTIGTYSASDSDGDAVTSVKWSIENRTERDVAQHLKISRSGVLTWSSGPPSVGQAWESYQFRAVASSRIHTTSKLDASFSYRRNSTGTVSLTFSKPPRMSTEMTAGLTEGDPYRNLKWSWHRIDADDDADVEVIHDGEAEGATLKATHTPGLSDVGHKIRVTAHYDDDHSTGVEAELVTVAVEAARTDPTDGTLTLSLAEGTELPRVNFRINAELEDPDVPLSDHDWTWERVTVAGVFVKTVKRGGMHYTPKVEDIGYRIRAEVTYTDLHAPGETASATTDVPVVPDNRPGPPNGSINLTNVDPPRADQEIAAEVEDEDGVRNVNWTWVVFTPPTEDGTARQADDPNHGPTFTPGSNDVGKKIRVTALYDDKHSTGISLTKETEVVQAAISPPEPSNTDPHISGDSSVRVDEGFTGILDTYIGSDEDLGDEVSWLVMTGTDAALFDLADPDDDDDTDRRVSRTLSFDSAPDFEHKATYNVKLRVSDRHDARDTKAVTVHLNNLDEAGSIRFPDIPKTCVDGIRATLTDPDGGISFADPPPDKTYGWQWRIQDSPPEGGDAPAPVSVEEVYEPKNRDAGKTLHVTAKYEDAQGPLKTAAGSSITIEANVPRKPTALTATTGQNRVRLSWTAADDCGKALTRYEYRYRRQGTSSWTTKLLRNGSATSLTVTGLAHETTYDFELRASNRSDDDEGYGARTSVSATTPPEANVGPVLTEVTRRDVREATEVIAGVYRGTDANGDAITWSLLGEDRSSFDLADVEGHSDRRRLEFRTTPNYEVKSTYDVDIKITEVTSEQLSDTIERTVNVLNGPDPGSISFSPASPQACRNVTAILTDEDGGITMRGEDEPDDFEYGFFWEKESASQAASVSQPSGQTLAGSKDLDGTWAGKRIRVTAKYGDNYSDRNEAEARSVGVRSDVPKRPPGFTADSSDDERGTIALSWKAPDNCGETIDYYQYSYKKDSETEWVRDTTTNRSVTLTGLDDDTDYDVSVRAHNNDGFGSSASTSATTIEPVNTPGTLTIDPRTPQAGTGFTLTVTDPDGVSLTSFGWNDVDASDTESSSRAQSERSNSSSLDFSTPTLAVGKRIKGFVDYTDAFGPGQYASVLSNVVVAGVPTVPRSVDASRGDEEVTLGWEAPGDDRGSKITGYDYNYKIDGGSWLSTDENTSSTSVTITGLTNGSLYHFRVRARNPVGTSGYVTDTATPAGVPDAPSGFSHGRSSATSVTVSWDEPEDNGADITGYFWYKRQGPMWSAPIWVTHTEFTDDNSLNTRSHRYGFRAKNPVGESSMSEYTVPAEERSAGSKPVADWADSVGFGVMAAPNPFNAETMITLSLPEEMAVTLTVHSITGQMIAKLHESEMLKAGVHTIRWRGRDEQGRFSGSGIYLYRLIGGSQVRVGKMVMLR